MKDRRRGQHVGGIAVATIATLLILSCTREEPNATRPDHLPDVVFDATPQETVEAMLELAEVKKDDVVYDLGCGDGRFVMTAARKYGCKAFGFDNDPAMVRWSQENVQNQRLEELVTIRRQNIFALDLRPASVVTLYLLPTLNVKLIPQLEQLKPGSRIVSYLFDMRGIKPKKVVDLPPLNNAKRQVYLWVTPLERETLANDS